MQSKVYALFGANGTRMQPITADSLPLGQVVSYEDQANPAQQAIVIEAKGSQYGQRCLFVDDLHESTVSRTVIDGPGGWRLLDRIADQSEIDALRARAEVRHAQRRLDASAREAAARQARERGLHWLEANRPDWAKALIVAERHVDQSDSMTNYFASRTDPVLCLAWSKHTRNLFPELRKAAAKAPETAHLGPRCGEYRAIIVAGDFPEGAPSEHLDWGNDWVYPGRQVRGVWHDLPRDAFATEAEAAAWITAQSEPGAIAATDQYGEDWTVQLHWAVIGGTGNIEHRDDYSGGHGYWLGRERYRGWHVAKLPLDYGLDAVARRLGDNLEQATRYLT